MTPPEVGNEKTRSPKLYPPHKLQLSTQRTYVKDTLHFTSPVFECGLRRTV